MASLQTKKIYILNAHHFNEVTFLKEFVRVSITSGTSGYETEYITSDVLEHKWRASLKTILLILTSNTEATGNKVQYINLAYRVKGFQCHSNNSLQLLGRKKKKQQQNNTRYLKVFFVIFFS